MSGYKVVTFPNSPLPIAAQDVIEIAASGVRDAVFDFINAANEATTPQRCIQIRHLIDALMVELGTAEMIALDRADRLC